MSEQDNDQEVELEEQIDDEDVEEEDDLDEEEEEELEEEEESEDDEESTDDAAEALKAENAKLRRLLKKKSKSISKPKASKPEDEDLKQDVEFLKMSEKKRQFGFEHGLSPEETDKVYQIDPNPSKDTLKDPFIRAGLKAIRRRAKVTANTPTSSAKSSLVSKDFAEASPEEKQAAYAKYMQKKGIKV